MKCEKLFEEIYGGLCSECLKVWIAEETEIPRDLSRMGTEILGIPNRTLPFIGTSEMLDDGDPKIPNMTEIKMKM